MPTGGQSETTPAIRHEPLKKALRAAIGECESSRLDSVTRSPSDRPTTGKIAVKVINHFGDAVLKVDAT